MNSITFTCLLRKYRHFFIIFLVSSLFIIPQLITKNMIIGSDAIFHFNRFYDAAMQIKHNDFEYFICKYGFQQSGRIVNALYSPFFSYFQGLLVLIGGSWFNYQVLSNFSLYLISGLSMYALLKKFAINCNICLATSIIFMSTYAVQYWVTRQGFTSWGAAIFPLCLLPIVDMIDKKSFHPVQLGLLTALMFQIHYLSCVLLVICYLLFFIFAFSNSKRKLYLFKIGLLSVLLFFLMTLDQWSSLYSIYSKNTIQAPFVNFSMAKNTIHSNSFYWLLNPGYLPLLILFNLYFAMRKKGKRNRPLKLIVAIGVLFMLMSTGLIPWTYLVNNGVKIVEILQFPFRFFVPATVFFLIAFSMIMCNWQPKLFQRKRMIAGFVAVSVIQTVGLSFVTLNFWDSQDKYIQSGRHTLVFSENTAAIKKSFLEHDLSTPLQLVQKSTPDYLPISSHVKDRKSSMYEEYKEEIINNSRSFIKKVEHGKLILTWSAKTNGEILLPLVAYSDTKLVLNSKVLANIDYETSSIGALTVCQNKGNNRLVVTYKKPLYFNILLSGTIICFAVCLFLLIDTSIRKYLRSEEGYERHERGAYGRDAHKKQSPEKS